MGVYSTDEIKIMQLESYWKEYQKVGLTASMVV